MIIEVKGGCAKCPLYQAFDMAIGGACCADKEIRTIKENKKFQIITPDWCPLNFEEIIIKKSS